MNYPKGLIEYTTENHKLGKAEHILRPKTLIYATMLLGLIIGLFYAINTRIPLEVDIIRDRSSLYTYTHEGLVENVYSIKMLNMSQQELTYTIDVTGIESIQYLGKSKVKVKSGEVVTIPIRLVVDPIHLKESSTTIHFIAKAIEQPSIVAESESRFLGKVVGK
ncbi:MAG: hypothetical protein GY781_08105 [Gammaproteobacteria bacterium]|nr:hypothetical protein [Gammaproteobacteria bacterium]